MPIPQRGLKQYLAADGKAINGWCSIPSMVTAEIVARAGYDTVTVDLQHGLIDYQMALAMLQAVDGQGMPTLCRVPWNEPGIIMKALDAGFTGIICPMINTKEEAERFAASCRYAPAGARSFGPTRAMQVHGGDYARTANQFIATFAMIETAQAMENLDAILAVEGIDAVYIGPADLGLSLGFAPTLLPEPAVLEAIATIRDQDDPGRQARRHPLRFARHGAADAGGRFPPGDLADRRTHVHQHGGDGAGGGARCSTLPHKGAILVSCFANPVGDLQATRPLFSVACWSLKLVGISGAGH